MTLIAKPRPRLLEKREQHAAIRAMDRVENLKVKTRSGGQCEVQAPRRCARRAFHVHHLMSGIGRRNMGPSILADHKLHVCENCHAEIHGHVLKPTSDLTREDAATVRYERIR